MALEFTVNYFRIQLPSAFLTKLLPKKLKNTKESNWATSLSFYSTPKFHLLTKLYLLLITKRGPAFKWLKISSLKFCFSINYCNAKFYPFFSLKLHNPVGTNLDVFRDGPFFTEYWSFGSIIQTSWDIASSCLPPII